MVIYPGYSLPEVYNGGIPGYSLPEVCNSVYNPGIASLRCVTVVYTRVIASLRGVERHYEAHRALLPTRFTVG